ncbi:hypothetical protein C483_18273 [Natrialba hulunbeirensis JCM 10989]|uniref:Uncharacterized protein n=1 Tax=Natrialba hulunbeirensis JCM 10989 TaxID=1227493 RepID=L9ZMW9_9EURY|nr:hypothetical protein [Natrialba hulunbeirensis]ELY87870.1 hypothetical protein C483_18273 [Natrialba hulunbeirensis JCM 10989]
MSSSLLAVTATIIGSHLLELRRNYFGTNQYEELSAHMVLEIPCRIIIFAIGFFSLLTLVGWILFSWR